MKELWVTDGAAPDYFRASRSRTRFLLLLRALRFDKLGDRKVCKEQNIFTTTREVFKEFNAEFRENYQIAEYTAIDEMVKPFRGRSKFCQYIPIKSHPNISKSYALEDSHIFYTRNFDIYAGRQPDVIFKKKTVQVEC